MTKATIQIAYDGPALDSGSMDVRELAPALMAFGDLFESANRIVNKERCRINVKVRAEFRPGSFGIEFEVLQSLSDSLGFLANNAQIQGAISLAEIIGLVSGSAGGLYWLIKRVMGRKPTAVKKLDAAQVELTFEQETIIINQHVFEIYRDVETRQALEKTLSPLLLPGITEFQIKESGRVVETVTKQDLPIFALPEATEQELVQESTREAVFSITSLAFKEDNKWRLSDGQNTFHVVIADDVFLEQINTSRIAFAKGDLLRVELSTRQFQTHEGLKTDYKVIRVIEHITGARQLVLF